MSNTHCAECIALADEMRVAFVDLMKRSDPKMASLADIHKMLSELFAFEEKIAQLQASFLTSSAGVAYARWVDHRLATGHTAFALLFPFN
jgi:hypothetical protein